VPSADPANGFAQCGGSTEVITTFLN
jgi:hypothetical protein